MKEFILSRLGDLNIIDYSSLNKYVDFCISRNVSEKIVGETAQHHILPNKLFPEYSNLGEFMWNGVHLKHSDHYYAHWLITEAVDNSSMLYAFCAMHFKDFKLKRITEEDLLPEDIIQEKMKLRSSLVSENNLKRHKDGTLFGGYKYCRVTSLAKRNNTLKESPHISEEANKKHSITINSIEWKETTGKVQILKRKETISAIKQYEERRIEKFLESYKKYQQTDDYKINKFKSDVAQSKLNNVVIYDKNHNVVYCVLYLFSRFCKEHNLPLNSLLTSIRTSVPLYNTNYKLLQASKKGYEKFEGWYAVRISPEMV